MHNKYDAHTLFKSSHMCLELNTLALSKYMDGTKTASQVLINNSNGHTHNVFLLVYQL